MLLLHLLALLDIRIRPMIVSLALLNNIMSCCKGVFYRLLNVRRVWVGVLWVGWCVGWGGGVCWVWVFGGASSRRRCPRSRRRGGGG